jgi:hypothetical protein
MYVLKIFKIYNNWLIVLWRINIVIYYFIVIYSPNEWTNVSILG